MNIDLSSMTTDRLVYVKQKLATELRELDLDITRTQERLDARLQRRSLNAETLSKIESKLNKAQAVLAELNDVNASTESITSQGEIVDELQHEYDSANVGNGVLTDEEAVLQQLAINRLNAGKAGRETEISDIDTILASR